MSMPERPESLKPEKLNIDSELVVSKIVSMFSKLPKDKAAKIIKQVALGLGIALGSGAAANASETIMADATTVKGGEVTRVASKNDIFGEKNLKILKEMAEKDTDVLKNLKEPAKSASKSVGQK